MLKYMVFFLTLIFLGFWFACGGKKHPLKSSQGDMGDSIYPELELLTRIDEKEHESCLIDTSLCDIVLGSYKSVVKAYGDIMGDSINAANGYETFYFATSDTSEYLKTIFFPGSIKNAFSRFVVTMFDTRPEDRSLHITPCPYFITENKIRLGITEVDLVKIKGRGYIRTKEDSLDVYVYNCTINSSSYVYRKYRMPIYSAIYRFYNNRLVEFEFGFEYP